MFQTTVPHHNTGGFTSHRKFLPDKEYGDALDTLVKACSDMLLLHPAGDRILLGKRKVHPQPDWWFTGGRIFPGETPVQSCCRLLKRELSLDIAPDRFQTVCAQSLAWGMREQLPKEHGTTDSQVVLSLRLTEAEVEKVVLDPNEYAPRLAQPHPYTTPSARGGAARRGRPGGAAQAFSRVLGVRETGFPCLGRLSETAEKPAEWPGRPARGPWPSRAPAIGRCGIGPAHPRSSWPPSHCSDSQVLGLAVARARRHYRRRLPPGAQVRRALAASDARAARAAGARGLGRRGRRGDGEARARLLRALRCRAAHARRQRVPCHRARARL